MFGNVNASLDLAVAKGNTLHNSKNGPFNLLILLATSAVLDAPAFEKLKDATTIVNLPTYIILTDDTKDQLPYNLDTEGSYTICPNLTVYAHTPGKPSSLKTIDGLELAWATDLNAKASSSTSAVLPLSDILITDKWPSGVLTHVPDPKLPPQPQLPLPAAYGDNLGAVMAAAQPRYHFVSSADANVYWERLPFRVSDDGDGDNDDDNGKRVTRFISLAKFGGPVRWHYAFNIDVPYSASGAGGTIPANATSNPFLGRNKQQLQKATSIDDVRFSHKRSTYETPNTRAPKRRNQHQPIRPDTCFLCLSNPNLAKHLLASISSKCYLSLTKGPLQPSQSQSKLPTHVMIVPIAHVPVLSPNDAVDRAAVELDRWKYAIALSELFRDSLDTNDSSSSSSSTVTVLFDISRSRGIHLHTQVMAIPGHLSSDLEKQFIDHAERAGLSMIERDLDDDETEYFRVQIIRPSSGEAEKSTSCFVIELPEDTYFDLQFGRKVLADVLGLQERVDWRACLQSDAEEKEDCKVFKEAFKKYDFTL